MEYFNEKTGKWERFGTSPVSDAYFNLGSEKEDQDKLLRYVLISSASKIEDMPLEESELIAVDMSGEVPIYSKGWKDFFSVDVQKILKD